MSFEFKVNMLDNAPCSSGFSSAKSRGESINLPSIPSNVLDQSALVFDFAKDNFSYIAANMSSTILDALRLAIACSKGSRVFTKISKNSFP